MSYFSNVSVFDHSGISWEWSIVFVESVLFFAGVEAWKYAKRVYIRCTLKDDNAKNPEDDLENGMFSRYTTIAASTLGEVERIPKESS